MDHPDSNTTDLTMSIHHPHSGVLMGYRVGGARPGPVAVVSGLFVVAKGAYDRLMDLPTFPHLRGVIYLIFADRLDDDLRPVTWRHKDHGVVDDILYLTPCPRDDASALEVETFAADAYWEILRFATRLGMISGKGVTP